MGSKHGADSANQDHDPRRQNEAGNRGSDRSHGQAQSDNMKKSNAGGDKGRDEESDRNTRASSNPGSKDKSHTQQG